MSLHLDRNYRHFLYHEKQINLMFNSRLYDNMMFGVGFQKVGMEVEMYDDDLGDKWEKS